MTPGARIAATIEILERIELPKTSIEKMISAYFRGRRYIGSKDRRAISERVFRILRHHARLLWWTKNGIARHRTIASLVFLDRMSMNEIVEIFNGEGYAPPSLTVYEQRLVKSFANQPIDNTLMPHSLSHEVPEWLFKELKSNWPLDFDAQACALNRPAPLDLRVNTLKTTIHKVLETLKKDGIQAHPTPFSPIGIRIHERVSLQHTTAFKGGFVEVQDEGSQLISLLVDSNSSLKTVDFCAGSGGKTLALASVMKNQGTLIACEVNANRFGRMSKRLKRAGVTNITRKLLSGYGDPWVENFKQTANRVLLDVPCSGSGLWRRSPTNKWGLTPSELENRIEQQEKILETGAKLVKLGGRLIYATCSILRRENEKQIEEFLSQNKDFIVFPIQNIWNLVLNIDCPTNDPFLNLTPANHHTDGFFCAVLERVS